MVSAPVGSGFSYKIRPRHGYFTANEFRNAGWQNMVKMGLNAQANLAKNEGIWLISGVILEESAKDPTKQTMA